MSAPEERRGPLLTVDLAAVAANTRLLAARNGGELMAVVKADGLGHGSVAVARTALGSGATRLGVATLGEALGLRAAGISAPVLSWLNPPGADFAAGLQRDVEVAVPGTAHLAAVAAAARRSGRRAGVHLHVDVGMARDGAAPAAWPDLCDRARRAEEAGLIEVVGVMGHLGRADVPDDPLNERGRRRFVAAVAAAHRSGLRPRLRHLAATAAVLTAPASHFDLCRVGAGLVGIDPSGSTRLRPALALTAPVVGVREVPAGTHVGYGRTHVTTGRTRLALLPLGYADGLPRSASGRGQVLLAGRRRPVVGLVSMDQAVVDVGQDDVHPGDVATVFGPGGVGEPTAADWAAWAGTIEHEVVTRIGPRVGRRAVPARSAPSARRAVAAVPTPSAAPPLERVAAQS